jgi:hypothetical protein
MQTKVKATLYASKLRAALKDKKQDRAKALKLYMAQLVNWRNDLRKWITAHASDRIDDITAKSLQGDRYSRHNSPGFDAGKFFNGAPRPPEYPGDKQIRAIQAVLRQLAMTGQQTITVSTEDVTRLMGDAEDED